MNQIILQSLPTFEAIIVSIILIAPGFVAVMFALSLSGGFINKTFSPFILLLWSLISSVLIGSVFFAFFNWERFSKISGNFGITEIDLISELALYLFGMAIVLGFLYATALVYELPTRFRSLIWRGIDVERAPESAWMDHLRDVDEVVIELKTGEQYYGDILYFNDDTDARREVRLTGLSQRGDWDEKWDLLDLKGNPRAFSMLFNLDEIKTVIGYPRIRHLKPLSSTDPWVTSIQEHTDYQKLQEHLESLGVKFSNKGTVTHKLTYSTYHHCNVLLTTSEECLSGGHHEVSLIAAESEHDQLPNIGATVSKNNQAEDQVSAFIIYKEKVKELSLDGSSIPEKEYQKFKQLRGLLADLSKVEPSIITQTKRIDLGLINQPLRRYVSQFGHKILSRVRYKQQGLSYPFENHGDIDENSLPEVVYNLWPKEDDAANLAQNEYEWAIVD